MLAEHGGVSTRRPARIIAPPTMSATWAAVTVGLDVHRLPRAGDQPGAAAGCA